MKAHMIATAFAILCCEGSAAAQGQGTTIEQLYTDCKSDVGGRSIACIQFLNGALSVMQGIGYAINDQRLDQAKRLALIPFGVCLTSSVSGNQLRQVFINWADQNPKEWQEAEGIGVWSALTATWPCRVTSP